MPGRPALAPAKPRGYGRESRILATNVPPWLTSFTHDLKFTVRQLAKARGFTAVAVLTLALGIGANTAIFTVVHHLLLAPVPYPDGNGIVMLMRTAGGGKVPFPPDTAVFAAWRLRVHSLETFGAAVDEKLLVAEAGAPDSVPAARVTPAFMTLLRVQLRMGRDFTPADARSAAAPAAIISYGLWQRAFGGRRNVLGTLVHANGRPYTVVGVAPPGLVMPMRDDQPKDVLLPLDLDSAAPNLEAYARLRPGLTPGTASREMLAVMHAMPGAAAEGNMGARAMRAQDFLGDRQTQTVKILFAAVGALLLIACANVANLLLARGWARRREFALRVALGAGRARLVSQVLAESVTLAIVGGALGLLVARVGLHVIIAMRPGYLYDLATVHIDQAVLLWSLAISVASGLVFGATPALLAGSRSAGDVLRSGARTASGGSAARGMRAALVVAEVALSLMLLVGAGLLVRSFVSLLRVPLGFDANGLVYAATFPKPSVSNETADAEQQDVVRRLNGSPGITGAQLGSFPQNGLMYAGDFQTEGPTGPNATHVHLALSTIVAPGYFRFAGIPLLAGRGFDSTSTESEGSAVVINRALAQRLWPGRNAIGLRLRAGSKSPWLTVIGVAGEVHLPGRTGDPYELQMYQAGGQFLGRGGILVRARDPAAAAAAVKRALAEAGPSLRLVQVIYPKDILDVGLAQPRFTMALIGAFALIALVLTAVGLYGVVAYAVTHRTREIGIRVALGAPPGAVSRLVLGQGLRLTAVGLVIGLVGAAFATRALTTMLIGVNPLDPLTFVAITVLLLATTLLAAYVPTRRALRVDPTEALRAD